ncbi:terminase endonuclease subunit [Pantoea sp. At-9b]|uniref:phage terminase small subunit n=1 Tax=Pantoea sp. (strain At-9b) TaxID=592316 RepID=UPI0001B3F219|nr:terminase endonuclease subunit [Pantoea sp. At-9b]ADU70724.1 small terminase subunit [Pantoea sp. At-9b]
MVMSPFQRHTQYVLAQEAARKGGNSHHLKGYDLMLMQLGEDRRRLKGIQSTVKKAEIKVEVLPKYAAWVEGVLAADGAQQDDVLMYVMLWRIDAGDFAGALAIGRHAIKHGWVMPQGFNRNVPTLLAEEMADAAKAALLANTPFDADLLMQTLDVIGDLDMPDQSRARLHKSIGNVLTDSQPVSALNHLRRALQLDEKCGVKKEIEQLERKIRNAS